MNPTDQQHGLRNMVLQEKSQLWPHVSVPACELQLCCSSHTVKSTNTWRASSAGWTCVCCRSTSPRRGKTRRASFHSCTYLAQDGDKALTWLPCSVPWLFKTLSFSGVTATAAGSRDRDETHNWQRHKCTNARPKQRRSQRKSHPFLSSSQRKDYLVLITVINYLQLD